MAKLPRLDERLAAAAELVPQGSTAADIGCDHGKLAAVLSGKCTKVIAVDSRPKPLAHAEKLMQDMHLANVECRLGDGLSAITKGECEYIIIAGLSCETICQILFAAEWIKSAKYHLILLPTRARHHILRTVLYAEGFSIAERIIKAQGRLYCLMHCNYSGKAVSLSQNAAYRGFATGALAGEYLQLTAASLLKSANGKQDAGKDKIISIAKFVNTEAAICTQQ